MLNTSKFTYRCVFPYYFKETGSYNLEKLELDSDWLDSKEDNDAKPNGNSLMKNVSKTITT